MFLKPLRNLISRLSIRLRLSLLFAAIFGTTTLVFNIFLFTTMIDSLQQDFDDALFNYAVDVSEGVEIGVKGDLNFPPLRLDHGKILPFPLGTALIQVRHSSGKVLERIGDFGNFAPPYKKDFEEIHKGKEATFRTIDNIRNIPSAEANSYRLISFPLDNALRPQFLLQIAVPMTLLETQIDQRLKLLEFGIPVVLLIATLGGLFLSARALKPVNTMIQATQKIRASDLSTRIPIPSSRDEIKRLAETLNEMLDRMQGAFLTQERFIADASHQLLTPLSILKGELELAQKSDRSDQSNLIKSSLQEVDNLSGIVQKMLLLARVDAGTGALNFQELSLDELIMESLPRLERLATAKNVKLVFNIESEGAEERKLVRGDRDLLENLIFNLVENAVKYSPNGESVHLKLLWKSKLSVFEVTDSGPGVPHEQLPFVFERFYRGADTSSQIKGFGLGLSIAKKIAELHSASLVLENINGSGARIRFEIKNI